MGFFSSLSFLAPLYVAAGLAVGLPILFHLIRRTPRGRQVFSSVMFLTPSPPRITRRSRIEHWLLLLLRAAAVLLIVAAFCRPLWRALQAGDQPAQRHETVVLLDTSASMRRTGLWEAAVQSLQARLDEAGPQDHLTILTFDDGVTPLIEGNEWSELEPGQRAAVVRQRLEALHPSWGGTELGRALIIAAERLEQADAGRPAPASRTIVILSDLQAGSRWQSLQGFQWPDAVTVEIPPLSTGISPTNAGVQIVGQPEIADPPFVRVRLTNSADSLKESFRIGWRGPFDDPAQTAPTSGAIDVYVPPGQSRVVRLPQVKAGPGETEAFAPAQVVLTGDDQPFDNNCYVTFPRRRQEQIVYLGPDDAADRTNMRFFVGPIFPQTAEREAAIHDGLPESTDPAAASTPLQASLVIVTGGLTESDRSRLSAYLQTGGTVLFVCRDADQAAGLYQLVGGVPQAIEEAQIGDYAMLRDVDFRHPLFAALNDPRYADVSKVHFWHHRVIAPESLPNLRVLAQFDNGALAVGEVPVGEGRVVVFTSSWRRGDSELATWSKFVPVMNAMLELGRPTTGGAAHLTVGEMLPLTTLSDRQPWPRALQRPDGTEVDWQQALADPIARMPGLYRVQWAQPGDGSAAASTRAGNEEVVWAVNLAADESRTAPLGLDVLESVGVLLTPADGVEAAAELRQEQMARSELESQQKLWRWLLIGALVVLLVETLVAARPASPVESAAV